MYDFRGFILGPSGSIAVSLCWDGVSWQRSVWELLISWWPESREEGREGPEADYPLKARSSSMQAPPLQVSIHPQRVIGWRLRLQHVSP